MQPSPFKGHKYFSEGLKLVLQPGLRLFVIIPLIINLGLIAALSVLAFRQFDQLMAALMSSVPEWLSFIKFLLWPLFIVLLLAILSIIFTLVANLLAAPFNGFLAEKVESVVRGTDTSPPFSWRELFALVPHTMAREMRKLAYFLPRAIALLILSLIPGINSLASPLWVLLGIWMMAVQYIDYPADNNKLGWNEMLDWLHEKRWQSLGFGGLTYLVLMIPVVNVVAMPAAVAGATLFWVREGNPIDRRLENNATPPPA